MHTSSIASAVVISLALGGIASASESLPRPASRTSDCSDAPRDAFKPEADLQAIVERLGYRVNRIGIDDACYEVIAADRNGRLYKVRFTGADLRMISRHEVKGERASEGRP